MWGFDDSAVAVLQNMKLSTQYDSAPMEKFGMDHYAILLKASQSDPGSAREKEEAPGINNKMVKVFILNSLISILGYKSFQ